MGEPTQEERRRVYQADLARLQREREAYRRRRLLEMEAELDALCARRMQAARRALGPLPAGLRRRILARRLPATAAAILKVVGRREFTRGDLLQWLGSRFTGKAPAHALDWLRTHHFIEWKRFPRGSVPGRYGPGLLSF